MNTFVNRLKHLIKPPLVKPNPEKIAEIFRNDKLNPKQIKNLVSYQEYLDIAFIKSQEKREDIFFNMSSLEASLLMANFLNQTQKQIFMLVGRFDGTVSEKGSYCEELKRCLEDNVSVDVIILDKVNENSKVLKILMEAEKSDKPVRLFSATDKTKKRLAELFPDYNGNVHFSIFDDNKYRLEIDPFHYSSIASFNAPKGVKNLIRKFRTELLPTTNKFEL